jgi:hypothetical protein
MFEQLLTCLEALLLPLVSAMETVIAEKGNDWNNFSDGNKHTVAAAASIAKAVKTVLDTPILTEDGKLTLESAKVVKEIGSVIDAYER